MVVRSVSLLAVALLAPATPAAFLLVVVLVVGVRVVDLFTT